MVLTLIVYYLALENGTEISDNVFLCVYLLPIQRNEL